MSSEHFLGKWLYFWLVVISGASGNIVSAAMGDICGIAVGASTSIMGLLSFQIIWFIVHWAQFGPPKYIYAVYLAIITCTMLFGGFTNESNIDAWGHIGGFFGGLLFTIVAYHM